MSGNGWKWRGVDGAAGPESEQLSAGEDRSPAAAAEDTGCAHGTVRPPLSSRPLLHRPAQASPPSRGGQTPRPPGPAFPRHLHSQVACARPGRMPVDIFNRCLLMAPWPGRCPELGCGLQLTPSRGDGGTSR